MTTMLVYTGAIGGGGGERSRTGLRRWAETVAFALLLVLLASIGAAAQETQELDSGTRVRLLLGASPTHPFGIGRPPLLEGTLDAVRSDTLLLRLHPRVETVAIPLEVVTRLEVSRGVPSRAGGAFRGAVRGLFNGVVLIPFAYALGGGDSLTDAVAVSLGAGALAGGVVGFVAPAEEWRRVEPPE